MAITGVLTCDGCGQPATPEHVAKRLQRLEWATRYRPLHIGTVLLGAASPKQDSDFLYSEGTDFAGEAKHVLAATGVSSAGKSKEAVLAEFQRAGFLLTYVMECPLDPELSEPAVFDKLLLSRVPPLKARIRRSFRPKRVAPISLALEPLFVYFTDLDLECSIVLDGSQPFAFDGAAPEQAVAHLAQALSAFSVQNR